MPGKASKVEDSVRDHNGQIISFSQGKDINKQRRKDFFEDPNSEDNFYVGGMCHFLSVYWIAHRNRDKSFWDWIRPNGTMDEKCVDVIIGETIVYKNSKNGLLDSLFTDMDKDANDMDFLNDWGLQKSTGSDQETAETGGPFDCTKLAKTMMKWKGKDRVFLISMGRDGGGHAMALQTREKGEVRFFDPNYGEAIFPSANDFADWFPTFMDVTGYKNKYVKRFGLKRFKAK